MTVCVDTLPGEGRTFSVTIDSESVNRMLEAGSREDVKARQALEAEVRLLPSGDDVFALGRLHVQVEYRCVRCLEAFEGSVNTDFHLTYAPEAEFSAEVELRREDLELGSLRDGCIDLEELVLEQLHLALWDHPVCEESCRGLCPQCGQNRNREKCGCADRTFDPRFAALARWKPASADAEDGDGVAPRQGDDDGSS